MDFASAYISMSRGHRIKRNHWSGYWALENNEVIMHTYDGKEINIKDSQDIMYTLSNCACNDWEIADGYGVSKELI